MPPVPPHSDTPPQKDQTEPADLGAQLAKLLGLSVDASPKELLAKLTARLTFGDSPDPAKFMPVSAVQEMLSVHRAEQAVVSEGRAREMVRSALNAGCITRGMQDWAMALCRSDESSFDQFLTNVGSVFAHLGQPARMSGPAPGRTSPVAKAEGEAEAAICAQLGLKPGTLAQS